MFNNNYFVNVVLNIIVSGIVLIILQGSLFHNVGAAKEKVLEPVQLFTLGILNRGPDNLSCIDSFLSVDIWYK